MRGSNPLISVIIPFFRDEAFLEEAIKSVLDQTYTNWELLLVDDGGSEAAMEIAKQYAQAHPQKIFYKSHPNRVNKGAAATRNLGVQLAKAEWLAFLDADDCWMPQKLEVQATIVQRFPESRMICEASLYWNSWKPEGGVDTVILVGNLKEGLYHPPQLLQRLYPFGKGAAPCPCSLLVHKKALEQVGGFEASFRGDMQLYEDQVMLTKMYLQFPVFVSRQCHNKYRERSGSCMDNVHGAGKYHMIRQFYLRFFESYLNEQNLRTKQTDQLLRKAWLPYQTDLKSRLEQLVDKTLHYLRP